MDDLLTVFKAAAPFEVPAGELTPVRLGGPNTMAIAAITPELRFLTSACYEVLLTVAWDPEDQNGRRFSHTALPDGHPLHSEAIEANVLVQLSGGQQLLRGTTVFGPMSLPWIRLEVWQDSGSPVTVRHAALGFRPMP